MALYDLTNNIRLKKVKQGQRYWAQDVNENFDRLDSLINQILVANPAPPGTPAPVFNSTYQTTNVTGVLDPLDVILVTDPRGRLVESKEYYSQTSSIRYSYYIYDDATGLLSTVITLFESVKTTSTLVYSEGGDLLKILSTEENGDLPIYVPASIEYSGWLIWSGDPDITNMCNDISANGSVYGLFVME